MVAWSKGLFRGDSAVKLNMRLFDYLTTGLCDYLTT